MRFRHAVACILVGVIATGCADAIPSGPPSPAQATFAAPTGAAPSPAARDDGSGDIPIDTVALLGSDDSLVIPPEPGPAAAYLAPATRDPASARAAVREILLRSGIGIFRSDTGALAAVPATPSLLDAYVYDFEVPLLADAIARGSSTTADPVLDLLSGIGWIPPSATREQVEDLIRSWMAGSIADPSAPLSFAGLAVQALLTQTAETATGGPQRLDPLALQLVMASLASGRGVFAGEAAHPPRAVLATVRGGRSGPSGVNGIVECNEPARQYDSGLWDKFTKELGKTFLGKTFGPGAATWGTRTADYGKMLSTVQARAALLSGLSITITSDAQGTPHYRHSTGDGGGSNAWLFTATARFNTGLGGRIVNCGGLAGLRIPQDGGIEGLRLQWAISDNVECTERSGNCDRLGRIPSGGGGATTDADGTSKLQVETIIEPGCPSDTARCRKGELARTTAWATVTPDLTTQPPIKLADLLFKPSSLQEHTAKALAKVLIDIATDIAASAQPAKGTQAVALHRLTDYKVQLTDRITLAGVKCGGHQGPWSLSFTGAPGSSTKATGTMDFTLDEDGRGTASLHLALSTTVTVGGEVIKAKVDVDGTGDVELVDPGGASALRLSNVQSRASGGASGSGGWGKLFATGSDHSTSIPVQRGSFCGR
jgi:hypothetical protein